MTLTCLQYKNYFDRLTKKEATLTDYISAATDYETIDDYDFNPADGVDTSIVLGGQYYDYHDTYNYLIVSDGNTIVSRWYIMDANRTRVGQYRINLHRDVLVDNWDTIKSTPMYIERATVSDNSKLIYNSEGLGVNQIKTSETLLKDESGCAWICGFVSPTNEEGEESVTGNINIDSELVKDYSYETKARFEELNLVDFDTPYADTFSRHFSFVVMNYEATTWYSVSSTKAIGPNDPNEWSYAPIVGPVLSCFQLNYGKTINEFITALQSNTTVNTILNARIYSSTVAEHNPYKYTRVGQYNNKILETTSDSKYYKLTVTNSQEAVNTQDANCTNAIMTYLSTYVTHVTGGANVVKTAVIKVHTLNTTETARYTTSLSYPAPTARLHLKDAPYDMFIIPYAEHVYVNNSSLGDSWSQSQLTKLSAINLAQCIAKGLGSFCYDVQLLPYCPATGFDYTVTSNGIWIDIKTTDTKRYTQTSDHKGIIIWTTASSGTKDIECTINVDNIKMTNETDKYRLCSPNYNGQFEFSAAKNGGISYFNVDYTYLPGSSYIHVNPDFGGLYGQDFNDARGLICQGDFSISIMNDKWIEYQIQNKNYENTFKRDITNMETNRKYQRIQEAVGGTVGALSTGITTGALTGNAIAGVGAGIASAAGAAADIYINEKLYNEAKSYATDKYNMSLENIQALPQSITKTTAYTENNKVFPVLEYYTCTDEEKTAIANKIRYEGMTVGVTGTIQDYISNNWSYGSITDKGFIRGRFYQLPIPEDFHMASSIEKEIEKGVYTKWE